MTLQQEKDRIYSELTAELESVQEELEKGGQQIEEAIKVVKGADDGDARENAGLDVAKEELAKLYQLVLMQQQSISKFQKIEERTLFSLLFPELAPPENCFEYNSVGRAVLYSTLRLKVHRGDGTIQDLVVILMPSGFNFTTMGCCSVDNPAVKLLLGARPGARINYSCITGEKVVYEVVEIL